LRIVRDCLRDVGANPVAVDGKVIGGRGHAAVGGALMVGEAE